VAQIGRPREFDTNDALDKAVEVFWRQGYEGTTLMDLTRAMGISKPSLYSAFGSKEETFKKALTRYARVDMAYVDDALAEPTAFDVASHYLNANVAAVTTPGKPAGCLSIQGGLSSSTEDRSVIDFLNASRADAADRFTARFTRAQNEGDLASEETPADLAAYVTTVSAGIAVQAASGSSREQLLRVASRALLAFPRTARAVG